MLPFTHALAQGSRADYDRADSLPGGWADLVRNEEVRLRWMADNRPVFQYELADGSTQWRTVDLESGGVSPAFDMGAMNAALAEHGLSRPVRVEWFDTLGDRIVFLVRGDARLWTLDPADNTIEPLDANDPANRFGIQPSGTDRTTDGGFRTTVIIVNATSGPIEAQWLDFGGNAHQYAVIRPGDSHRQGTYAGHAWRIINQHGKGVGVYKATADPGVVLVQDDSEPAKGDKPASVIPPAAERTRAAGADWSPDGSAGLLIEDHQLLLVDRDEGTRRVLTDDGSERVRYSGISWSPDSSRFVVLRTERAARRKVRIVESSPDERLQPDLIEFDYTKPGDEIDQPRPLLFNAQSGEQIEVDHSMLGHTWSITRGRWSDDSGAYFYLYNERGHQKLRVVRINAATGESRVVVDERSETFIDYSSKTFLRFLDGRDALVWMSERSGWNHLYLYDQGTGELRNPITQGEWVVQRVDRIDEQRGSALVRVMGYYKDQDPYNVHFARVNLDGSGFTMLTEGDGTHTIEYSPDARFYTDTYSRVDLPPMTELRRSSDGSLVAELARGDWTELLEAGWNPPERFVAKGRDGETDIWGYIEKPTRFDPSAAYPVIESIYAGPHGHHVPKSFRVWGSSRSLSELGFVLVHIDGMGTNWRSKAFHNVAFKNLKDAGFPDRIAWMKAAAAGRAWMDIDRVGIYGVSAGGQNAMGALLFHNDFYDAAVADCGCHDNRMDKIWWNEAWMGLPGDGSYVASSNTEDAHKLDGALLLTVGELDRNVDPASTYQVVDALRRAGKEFEFMLFPGMGHGAGDSDYGRALRLRFFKRELAAE